MSMPEEEAVILDPKAPLAAGTTGYGKAQSPVQAILRNLYGHGPLVTTTADALALAREAVSTVRPYPEKVEVHDQATFTQPLARPRDMTYGYFLTMAEENKARAIRSAVRRVLEERCALARVPDLLLVADGRIVTSIWDDTVRQVAEDC